MEYSAGALNKLDSEEEILVAFHIIPKTLTNLLFLKFLGVNVVSRCYLITGSISSLPLEDHLFYLG